MKKTVERRKSLPAFSIGMGELELLWNRVHSLFDGKEPVQASIDISLKTEKLDFSSLAELRNYEELDGKVTRFSMWFSQGERRLFINCGQFSSSPSVSAKGESDAWCAGAIETVYAVLDRHRIWYNWFISDAVGNLFYIVMGASAVFPNLLLKTGTVPPAIGIAWIGSYLALGFLYFARGAILPSAIIVVKEREGFIKRHIAELSLLIALASAVLTVIGWFIGSK